MRAPFLQITLSVAAAALFMAGCSPKPVDTTQRDEIELSQDPDLENFRRACEQENPEEAYRYARGLTERFPRNGSAWSKLGYASEGLGKKDLAFKHYQKAIEVNPSNAKAWYNLGIQWGDQQQLDKEVDCYRKAVELRPNYVKAWANLSVAYSRMKRDKESAMALKRAIDADPHFARWIEVSSGKPGPGSSPSASSRIAAPTPLQVRLSRSQAPDESVAESPPLTNYFVASAATLLNRNAPSVGSPPLATASRPAAPSRFTPQKLPPEFEAQVVNHPFAMDFKFRVLPAPLPYERMAEKPVRDRFERKLSAAETAAIRTAKEMNNRGMEQESRGQYAAAVESYRKALAQLKDNPLILNNLGIALAEWGKHAQAVRVFQEVLEKSPDSKPVLQNLSLAQVNVATGLIRNGKVFDARILLQEVLSRQPDFIEARCQLIPLLVKENRWDEAQPHYETLTEQLPDSVAAWYGLGYAWYRLGKGRSAIKALGKAIGFEPRNPEFWHLYGLQHIRIEDYKNAAFSLEQSAKWKPDNAETWYQLGIVHSQLQSWNDAVAALQKALQIKADWDPAQKALAAALAANGQGADAQTLYEKLLRRAPSQGTLW